MSDVSDAAAAGHDAPGPRASDVEQFRGREQAAPATKAAMRVSPEARRETAHPRVFAVTPTGVDRLFRERAFWMYLTAHRLGDMRRLVRQYGRAIDEVYPSGQYFTRELRHSRRVRRLDERTEPAGGSPPYTGCTNLDP